MDVGLLFRLKGMCEAAQDASTQYRGQGVAESYPRIRGEILDSLDPRLAAEFERLFPSALGSSGQPWKLQAEEAKALLGQMAGCRAVGFGQWVLTIP
jgi:hypothetical protein